MTDRVERFAPLATGLLLAALTLAAYYPPMSDLPLHEGVVGLLRHFGDPEYVDPKLYELNLGHPNQLFHLVCWPLSYVVGTRWAAKLVIAATQIAILQLGARLSDHLGRSRWGAVLLAPIALGFTYYWGLVANLLGFAVLFAALPLIDRLLEAPSLRLYARVAATLVVLFLAHESAFVMALCFIALVTIARPIDRRAAPRLGLLVGCAAVPVGYYFWSRHSFTGGQVVVPPAFPSLWEKAYFLPAQLVGSHDGTTRLMLLLLGLAGLGGLAAARVRSRERRTATATSALARAQALLLHYRFEATAVGFTVGYLIAPQTIDGATMIYQRFLGPAWALFALTAAPRSRPPRLAGWATAALPLGMVALSWPQFVDSDRTYRNLDAIIAEIPKNSSVALASVDRAVYRTRIYSASTGPARSVAERGGRASLSLVMSPISIVHIRNEYRWDELDRRILYSGSRSLMPSWDLERFGWVIAQSRDPEVRDIIITSFKPDAELVDAKGEWLLLRSTHPQVPMASPDRPPRRVHDTILERVARLTQERNRRGPTSPLEP